jgi:hypothetical protein
MSSDRSAVALERLAPFESSRAGGAGLEWEDRLHAAAPACDLAELASALARVQALLAAGTDETPVAAAALERIADIAFVLHEREVERSLCDALDAAMREISAVNVRNRESVQRAREAAELLRALAPRLDAMIAAQTRAADATIADAPAAGAVQILAGYDELECADEFPAPARLFDADVAPDGAFAQTVAELAQSLPEPAEAAPVHQDGTAHAVTGAAQQAAPHESGAETSTAAASADAADFASRASSSAAAAEPVVDPRQAIDPDEDPGELFEPLSDTRPAPQVPTPLPAMNALEARQTAPPGSIAAPQWPHGSSEEPACASQPAANDPLAPIRALSEEELIALFS